MVFTAIIETDAQGECIKDGEFRNQLIFPHPVIAMPAGLAGDYTTLQEGLGALTSNLFGLANQIRKKQVSFGFKKKVLDINTGDISNPIKTKNGIIKKSKRLKFANIILKTREILFNNTGGFQFITKRNDAVFP